MHSYIHKELFSRTNRGSLVKKKDHQANKNEILNAAFDRFFHLLESEERDQMLFFVDS